MLTSALPCSPVPTRSSDVLAGGDFLSTTALSTGQLPIIGPVLSAIEGTSSDPDQGAANGSGTTDTSGGGSTASTGDPLLGGVIAGDLVGSGATLQPVANVANVVIDEVHALLEDVGHTVPVLNGPIHDLINVGTTVGLGEIGEDTNLITDTLNLPGDILSGHGSEGVGQVVTDVGAVLGTAGTLVGNLTGGATGILAPIGSSVGGTASGDLVGMGAPLQPVADVANGVIGQVHGLLENVGGSVPLLNEPINDLVNLGKTIGLGTLGDGSNLLTDTLNLPGDLLSGHGGEGLGQVVGDVGEVLGAAGTLVGSLTGTVGGVLSPIIGSVGGAAGSDGGLLGGLLGSAGGSEGGLLGGILGHGDGSTGSDGGLLGGLLGGAGGSEGGLLGGVLGHGDGSGTGSDGGLLGGLLGNGGGTDSGLLGGIIGHGDGSGGGLLGGLLGGGGDASGSNPLIDLNVGPVTDNPLVNLDVLTPGTGSSHLIDVEALNLGNGGDLLGGLLGNGSGSEGGLLGGVLGHGSGSGGLLGGILGGGDAAGSNPLIDANIGGVTPTPIANVDVLTPDTGSSHAIDVDALNLGNGGGVLGNLLGNTGGSGGGLLGGVIGQGSGSGGGGILGGLLGGGDTAGAHPLIDANVGPVTPNPIANLDVLTPGTGSSHAIDVDAIGVGSHVPTLLSADLLNADSIAFPAAPAGGGDALVGSVLDHVLSPLGGADHTGTAHPYPSDVAMLPDHGSDVSMHHSDPTSHGGPSPLHLLGL